MPGVTTSLSPTRRRHAFTRASLRPPNRGPADFAELLLVPGVGARTVRALHLVAELFTARLTASPILRASRLRMAGRTPRHPFPAPLGVDDETISVTRRAAVQKARLGQEDRLAAIRRLDDEARRVEASAVGPALTDVIAEERRLLPLVRRPQRLWLGEVCWKRSGRRPSPLPVGGDKSRH